MPNWKKVIVSGSDASLNSLIVATNLAIGTSSIGTTESNLVVGTTSTTNTGEGGQMLLQASGGLYASASMLDNYQNRFRILRGTNAGSDAEFFNISMHDGQVVFNKYSGSGAFTGTVAANLAVDSAGRILTTAPGAVTSASFATTASYAFSASTADNATTASRALQANTASYVLNAISSSYALSASNAQTASFILNAVSSSYALSASNAQTASYILNAVSSSYALSASNAQTASFIATASWATNASNALTSSWATNVNTASWATNAVNAMTSSWATNVNTASWANNAISASYARSSSYAFSSSYAVTASHAAYALNADLLDGAHLSILAITGSNTFVGNQTITGSTTITGSLTITGSTVSTLGFTGSLFGTASFATSASWAPGGSGASFPYTGSAVITGSLIVTGSAIATAFSGTFSGSHRGDGSGLTGITATAAPAGPDTSVQFRDGASTSGSGNFLFNKTNVTVTISGSTGQRLQLFGSGSTIFTVTGSQGELFKVADTASGATLATISSGSTNVFTFTTSSLDVTGSVDANIVTNQLVYGVITATPSVDQNDYAPTGWNDTDPNKAATIDVSGSQSIKITGLAGGTNGRIAIIRNSSASKLIILEDQSVSSSAANRFDFRNPVFLPPNGTVHLMYDGASQRWEPLGSSANIEYQGFFNEYDDFIGGSPNATTLIGTGVWGSAFAGTGASVAISTYLQNTTEKTLGTWQATTGTTATGRAHIGSNSATLIFPGYGQAVMLTRLAPQQTSISILSSSIWAGWHDAVGTTAVTDGVYWQYSSGSALTSSRWQGMAASTSVSNSLNAVLGPTVDTNYIWLGIFCNSTWTQATYFYSVDSTNWVIAGEYSGSTMPSSASATGFGVTINKNAGIVANLVSVDLLAHRYDITRG